MIVAAGAALLLNVPETNAMLHAVIFDRSQKIAQLFFVELLPFIGAIIVIYVIRGHRVSSLDKSGAGFWANTDNWFWAALGSGVGPNNLAFIT